MKSKDQQLLEEAYLKVIKENEMPQDAAAGITLYGYSQGEPIKDGEQLRTVTVMDPKSKSEVKQAFCKMFGDDGKEPLTPEYVQELLQGGSELTSQVETINGKKVRSYHLEDWELSTADPENYGF